MRSVPLAKGEKQLRTIHCCACGMPRTFERGVGADPKYCDPDESPECAEFGRMTVRWVSAAKALVRRLKRRKGKHGGVSIRMRVVYAIDKAVLAAGLDPADAAELKDVVRDEAAV